ncbi:hypothetical protein GSI_13036 [Ganoderma sinense ZZ0214-1]|uniref:GAR domain-containing protein n=1 Tax=Ganoderma sinense ZZ0214-1 TaxID=1077348 RepID=A0A2G8RUF8_9APHY|nr:hypothetical protein GSI_13036 [Ganoderma sinense ZZ0214-1]
MVSLALPSLNRSSSILSSSSSRNSITHVPQSPSTSVPPSPVPSTSSSSSGSDRLSRADDEDATITFKRASIMSKASVMSKGKERSTEDLRILAAQHHMTELTYTISDIQTRIFEIQELRHKSQSSGDASNATTVDQSLATLDERLESVSKGVKIVNDALEPLLNRVEQTPTLVDNSKQEEEAAILRVHAALVADWEAVQKDIQVLREELKEDKWLTVFRTVTDQADGMMSSLEKAVNRCQDFMWQVQKRGLDENLNASNSSSAGRGDRTSVNYETFTTLLESFEAKKKHYMPATTKVLSIIDKGVQDRVTKNGECLRRHAECTQRWRNLKERISRTDSDMENLRLFFLHGPDSALSSGGSSQSGATSYSKGGYLATPPSGEKKMVRSPSSNTISRSISPFRKIARKLKGSAGAKSPAPPSGKVTPIPPPKSPAFSRQPSSEPTRTLRHRSSMFHFNGGQPPTPVTPDRPSHKYSSSLTPDSSPSRRGTDANATLKIRPAWNSSTRVEADERSGTIKQSPRRPSVSSTRPRLSDDIPPVPQLSNRSVSRSSMASGRPWSPVTSSSTAQSSASPFSMYRPPSRARTPGLSKINTTVSPPRNRPKTPSQIPAPAHLRSLSTSVSSADSSPSRAVSPTQSVSGNMSVFPPRPPSRSMIPIPSVHVQSASRPGTAMSYRPDSAMSFRASVARVATPEGLLSRMTPRPRAPPSSFKDSTPRTPLSRPSSRAGAETPDWHGEPVHYYAPGNHRDPLDTEVATIVNSIPHSMIVERVDQPLRQVPKEGEEVRAQYAFSNQLGRKVVTCKLTTMARAGKGTTKKVMCRVGGGWQDLKLYVMTRQSAA